MTRLNTLSTGSAGPRIAFLHGLFGQGRNWMHVARALSGPDGTTAQCLLVDLPDHGRSPWTEEFSYRAYADAVAEELAATAPGEEWALIGHSLGGKVAMVTALAHPDVIGRLVAVDIAPKDYGDLSRFQNYIDGMRAMPLDEIGSRADADAWFSSVEPDPGIRAFLLQNLRRDGDSWRWQAHVELFADDAAAGQGSKVAGFPELTATFAPFEKPVLWLVGGESRYVKSTDSERMKALFPLVRSVTVRNAGHWIHTDAPEIVIETLRRFALP